MKPLKYTVAALALIAVASFTQSAKAGGAVGDVFLGLNNSSTSLEFDLGAFNTLSTNETWNLGTTVSSTLGTTGVQFDIAASGASAGGGGLNSKQVAFTAVTETVSAGTTPSAVYNTNMASYVANANLTAFGTSSNGTAFSDYTVANSNANSFATEFNNNSGDWGFGAAGQFAGAYPDTTDSFTLFLKSSPGAATADGTFVFSTNAQGQDILTFDPTATPEPSAYALGLCAVALFLVLRRRSSVA